MLIPFGILSAAASVVGRVGVAGYFYGGYNTSPALVKSATKLSFPSDTRSTITNALTDVGSYLAGFANSGVAGYAGGGQSGALARVDKTTFPSDTLSTLGTGLSSNSLLGAGMANSGVAGYNAIGDTTGGTNFVSTVDKFAFSNDGRSTLGTGLSGARGFLNGFGNVGEIGRAHV